jgi:hypothetical protein
MSIAPPDQLAALSIGGRDLGLTAPETWQGGTKVALKLWYYRNNAQTVIQRGRVTPQPVRLEFKLIGPDALNNALYLDSLAKTEEKPVPIQWASIAFDAMIETVEYSIQRTGVSVSLTCLPVTDPNRQVWLLSPPDGPVPVSLLGGIQAVLDGIQADIEAVAAYFDNTLTTLNDGLQQVRVAVATVADTLATVHDMAEAPMQVIASVRDTLVDAASAIVTGVVDLVAISNAAGELPSEIAVAVTRVANVGFGIDEQFLYVTQTLPQPTTMVVATEGQTVSDLADASDVTSAALFAINPELARAAPEPGQKIEVPYGKRA